VFHSWGTCSVAHPSGYVRLLHRLKVVYLGSRPLLVWFLVRVHPKPEGESILEKQAPFSMLTARSRTTHNPYSYSYCVAIKY